ncbi:MAG: sulfur carrier protein ThiS [Nitrospirae bacterium]|nr:sulfur carrier protein ThiS [Nitrospirota bacterium]MCL5422909.1 sulfur carrier protein ThiS [Nitrospirota bacterium]
MVNGEEYVTEKHTITQLLDEMGIVPGRVAVEVSLKVIKRADYDNFSLRDGDVIEIVKFVGGGQLSVSDSE